ncbi:hypothetical protein CGCF415_v005847 [Colletotrichum fructicola]|uniref:Uncharacterized protein n=1 Tax=Colletotrichum chrysophilum TaxID=1836956 RepID=A0AAD9AFY0_9PEZI|nr:uncharacterized protein COL26b_002661 [Colletotrichum chrysophilum]KAF4909419.1 hypothetical protein CGCF415_v005847 [Colletotrichum fructicola]KAF4935817.1 hypothetical protein CGCF245_v007230 [Colletotrichum fructicola]KAF5491188.1 hypothetical protein CGCF413_v011285 [Colletotrichum fructicola]KAJ0351937.1 hypothetical protein KNSL1_002925 [Colletotrichum chrysophilum]KAJ0366506.1 hypothetical protein COL154_003736 [Colletotrichum chrysophilum]
MFSPKSSTSKRSSWFGGAFKKGHRSSSSRDSVSSFASFTSKRTSRSSSLSSLFSNGAPEEQERLMVDEPVKKTPYVPRHAAKSYIKTTTNHEIRVNSEIL